MVFIRRDLALTLVSAVALGLLGCQEDNEKQLRAQAKLSAPADGKAGTPAPQPSSLDELARQAQQGGSAASTTPKNYPGISRIQGAAPAKSGK